MISFFDYTIQTELPKELPKENMVINTINPHSYCVAKKDELFKEALINGDLLIPDGIGIVKAVKWLTGKRIRKIAGADLHLHLLELAQKEQLKVFYLGASQTTLTKITQRISAEFPEITVGAYSPPYKEKFTTEENAEMVATINAFQPAILFVGMTAPKQEKWLYTNKPQLNVPISCAIGAVFDFYAGTVKRPHPFWIKLGLEWFIRFIKEPRRLAERNLKSMPLFIIDVMKAKLPGAFSSAQAPGR